MGKRDLGARNNGVRRLRSCKGRTENISPSLTQTSVLNINKNCLLSLSEAYLYPTWVIGRALSVHSMSDIQRKTYSKQTNRKLFESCYACYEPFVSLLSLKNFDNLEAKFVHLPHRPGEGLTLETLAFLPFTLANLRFQLSC